MVLMVLIFDGNSEIGAQGAISVIWPDYGICFDQE